MNDSTNSKKDRYSQTYKGLLIEQLHFLSSYPKPQLHGLTSVSGFGGLISLKWFAKASFDAFVSAAC